MKILILALPRTGSTSLMVRYANEYKLNPIFEPFDPLNTESYDLDKSAIVLKTMIYHNPNQNDDKIKSYVELSKKFNKIILLSRKDLQECAESWAYLQTYNHKGFDSTKEYVWKPVNNVEKYKLNIEEWHTDLLKIGKILNIDITYYEDIFDKNSNERYRKNIIINKQSLI